VISEFRREGEEICALLGYPRRFLDPWRRYR